MKYIAIIDSDEPFTEGMIQDIKNTAFCGDDQNPYVFEIEKVLSMLEAHGLAEEAKQMAIKALGQESCADCISRSQALSDYADWYGCGYRDNTFYKLLKDMPSVKPKPKTDVLDKIRAEIHANAEMHEDGDYYLRDEWIDEIFDKYKTESEDK